MQENMQPTPSSGRPFDHAGQDDSQDSRSTPGDSSPREAFPQRDDSSERARNERWENDLETDQMVDLIGDEAIQDRELSDEAFPADLSEDS